MYLVRVAVDDDSLPEQFSLERIALLVLHDPVGVEDASATAFCDVEIVYGAAAILPDCIRESESAGRLTSPFEPVWLRR